MVNGYSRSSQTRKDKRKTKEHTFNYVDRVRLGQSSLQKQYRPPCGSGWRQKSISNLDLSTNRHSSSHYIEDDRRLRPSRSLDYKHTAHKEDTLDIAEFYWRIDPEKDYEQLHQNKYVEESGYHSTNVYNQPFDIGNESCSLRRSRSLAVIREETFSDLQISTANSHRRSQLIPRARLVNRGFFDDRFTSSKQPTYYHHHHHQHQHHHHQPSTLDRAIAVSGESLLPPHTPPIILVAQPPETTTITRESDEYYDNLKRLDAHQQSIWQNEKSDLESLNSEYFRNSLHQSDSNCGGGGGGGGGGTGEKQRLYQSRSHKSTSHHRKYSSQYCGEESSCPELSQSSVFPETTTTSNSDDQSDSLTISEQEYDIERVEEILSKVYNEKFEVISLTEEQNQKRSENPDEQGALIAYDSVYLSSEESSEGTLVEGGKQDTASLLHISIEDIYDPPEKPPAIIEEIPIENPLYSQVLRVRAATQVDTKPNSTVDTKPKILALVEKKKKLKRFSDYAVVPTRESKGIVEHLTYISTKNIHQLIDNQYYSLPDVNIGKSLKVSERIDAKLRSSYNLKEETVSGSGEKNNESTRFGRANKKTRQRENDIQDNYRSEETDKNYQTGIDVEEEVEEKPREAPSIQVETYAKEIIAKEGEAADKRSTTPIELNQFRIIVTDAQNNVIEEDSIDGNSVPPLTSLQSITTEVQQSANGNHSNQQKQQQQQEGREDKLVEVEAAVTPPQPKRSVLCRTLSKSKRSTGTSSIAHSEVCKAKDRRLYGTYRARPIKVKPNDSLRRVGGKMSRPQVIQVVDSKKPAPAASMIEPKHHPLAGKQAEDEFLQKVDAIRCYWSKMNETNQLNQQEAQKEKEKAKEKELASKKEFIIGEEVKCVKPPTALPVFDEDFQSLMPSIEIVELDGEKHATIVSANADEPVPEFDHIRYKVMKPNLFRSNILNRSKKEAQFDGLIQYLQEYSFQELLTNNNVVIVEPVRTKIERPSKDSWQSSEGHSQQHHITKGGQNCKITGGAGSNSGGNTNSPITTTSSSTTNSKQQQPSLGSHNKLSKRHFFYQPVRVNRELLEEELPTPDTVRNVRKFFEENVLPPGSKRPDESSGMPEEVPGQHDIRQENDNEGRSRTAQRLRYLTIDTSYGNGQVNTNNNNNNGTVTTPTAGTTLRKWDSVSLSSGISSGDLSSPCECSNGASTVDGRSPSSSQHLHQMKDDNNEGNGHEQEPEIRGGMHVRDFIRRHNACGGGGSQDSNGLCGYYMDGGEDVHDGIERDRADLDDPEDEDDNEVDMVDDELCESYYVSEDVLEKIRECGSTVTYYGGRVMMHSPPATGATLRIPRSKIEFLTCNSCQPNECPHKDQLHDQLLAQQQQNYTGIKFKLVKSNSCSSRLELIGTQKLVGNQHDYPDTIGEDDSINGNTELTNDDDDEYDDGEPLVRRLVHRLETTGKINKYTAPRIIESQCIEKMPQRRPTSLVVQRQKFETSSAAAIAAAHKRFSEGFTINNQMVGKIPEQQSRAQLPKQVTVNNHINVLDSSSLTLTSMSSPCFTSSAMDIRLVEKAGGIDQAKLTNGKIRRNKNVDLAFTMKGPNGTLKSVSSSSTNMETPPRKTEATNNTITTTTTTTTTSTSVKNDRNYRNTAAAAKDSRDFGKNFNITEHFDGHLLMMPKEEMTVAPASTTGKLPPPAAELIVDKTLVRHYVTNDKRLLSKPKYDDIEFEEFEVYDPLKDATAKAEQLVDSLAEDITRAVSATSSYELKTSSSNNDDCCYDSLDDKI